MRRIFITFSVDDKHDDWEPSEISSVLLKALRYGTAIEAINDSLFVSALQVVGVESHACNSPV
jgi:hypothetical protein